MPRQKQPQPWGLLRRVDEYSLVRAIVLGQARADYEFTKATLQGIEQLSEDEKKKLHMEKKNYELLLMNRSDCQMPLVHSLVLHANPAPTSNFTPEHAKFFQKFLNKLHGKGEYRIHLFEQKNGQWRLSWAGYHPSRKNICLIYQDSRFNLVRSLRFFTASFYCENCLSITHKRDRHQCQHTCRSCGRSIFICIPDPLASSIHCTECGLYFLSRSCYLSHARIHNNGSRRCSTVCLCSECNRFYNTNMLPAGESHHCLETTYCYRCNAHREPGPLHKCYINIPTEATKRKLREKQEKLAIIAYDFETTSCVEKEDGQGWDYLPHHIVVSAVARKGCIGCFDKGIDDKCDLRCDEREKIFSYQTSESVISDFMDWLLQPIHDDYILIAHYELLRRNIIPRVLMNGRRLITAVIETENFKIHIRDSYNLIPLPLSAFRKAFNLPCEDKGEYPYLFIEPKRFGTVLKGLPAKKYFSPGSKTVEQRAVFEAWYNSHDPETFVYDVDAQLIHYNRMDTEILFRGLLAYRTTMMKLTSWCPISSAPTLASLTAHILRCNHLPRNTIVHLPEQGFSSNRNQSDMAIRFLKWVAHSKGIHIQHRENGGEHCFIISGKRYFVDGWTPPEEGEEKGTVWEFLGCYFHGCPNCNELTALNKRLNTTYGALLAATEDRLNKLREFANVFFFWECFVVKKMMRADREMRSFIDNCQNGRLILRQAMQGGRCEAFVRYAEASDTHKIVYYDGNSLYPHIMKTMSLPTGVPDIIHGPFPPTPSTEFQWQGIGCVTMLPPRDLRYPLLGVKMNGALLFVNCKKCATDYHTRQQRRRENHDQNQMYEEEDEYHEDDPNEEYSDWASFRREERTCTHSDAERAITGSWSHPEILKAISVGYLILAYHEIWHFPTFRDDLFTEYVRTFHRVKTTASGWPKGIDSVEDRQAFIDEYHRTMGGEKIRFEEMVENSSARSVAKMLLNTSWGRFAQRCMIRNNEFVDGDTLMDIMESHKKSISGHRELAPDQFLVSWAPVVEDIHSTPNSNLAIALFITSGARLYLYRLLELSQSQACYCDTDSIIARVPREGNLLDAELGGQLGQITDEAEGKIITRAIFGGPKQYAYEYVEEKTGEIGCVMKIRGITLDSDAKQNFTFDKMEEEIRKKKSKKGNGEGNNDDEKDREEGDETERKKELITTRLNLKRTNDGGIQSVIESRRYIAINKKGRFSLDDESVFPFGYVRSGNS